MLEEREYGRNKKAKLIIFQRKILKQLPIKSILVHMFLKIRRWVLSIQPSILKLDYMLPTKLSSPWGSVSHHSDTVLLLGG